MKLRLDLFGDEAFPLGKLAVYQRRPGDSDVDPSDKYFSGKRVREVTRESLLAAYHQRHDMTVIPGVLSDEAFAFYLPALLQAVIDGQDDRDTQLPDLGASLGHHLLTLAQTGAASARLSWILQSYSRDQLEEVARGLQELRDHDRHLWEASDEWEPAAEALRLFWGQYLSHGESKPNAESGSGSG